jgi:SAM-dependent methyltransferase
MKTMTTPAVRWQRGAAYERYMGRWSRQLAPRFLQGLNVAPASRWLDVGCGTGALAQAIFDQCAPKGVIGADPSAGFLAAAKERLPPQVVLHEAAADRLPLADASVDAAVSALVLNFVPDAGAALGEMVRVTVGGGLLAVCMWDYAQKMDLIRRYWDTAAELGLLAPGQDQGERFPICRPEALQAAFIAAGLAQVRAWPIEIEMHFADFDDYWQPFLGGQGPAPAHAMSLDEASRLRLRDRLVERIAASADGGIVLAARAWAASGLVFR